MCANLGWSKNGFMSRLGINYVSSYSNTLFAAPETIGSWTTADLYAGYDTGSRESIFLDNLKIGLSVQNVFDRRPPNVQIPTEDLLPGRSAIPFDGANASPVGRVILLQLTKRW
jgi:iron complex outermembrane recepter protein